MRLIIEARVEGGEARLAGNPWKAVNDPVVIKRANQTKIERALPAGLWRKLRDELDVRSAAESGATDGTQSRESQNGVQWRAVRAAILLMGDSGLRREEAASARRENLRPSIYGTLNVPVCVDRIKSVTSSSIKVSLRVREAAVARKT